MITIEYSTILLTIILVALHGTPLYSQEINSYPKAQVSFEDYEELIKEVKEIRKKRLIGLDKFLEFSKDKKTVILDARSTKNFNAIHIKNAINLPFSEFTLMNLRRVIPDTTTRILIYCNNNIKGEPLYFASKTAPSRKTNKKSSKKIYIPNNTTNHKSKFISLALNIPTYINLYGYGYRNIYELDELVDIDDKRVKFKRKK